MTVARRLKSSTIERRAAILLSEFQITFDLIERLPVPVDEILEGYLKFHLEFDNISARWGLEGIDGLTFPEERRVVIDERLDPHQHPELEGRYRFTLAHEIAHNRLHGQLGSIHALRLGRRMGSIDSYQELEWQADKFASYLLMPTYLVRREWRSVVGHDGPLEIDPRWKRWARRISAPGLPSSTRSPKCIPNRSLNGSGCGPGPCESAFKN